ncbi:NYN domain-containing protein [Hyphomicrobium sp.]|uniref:LabA-like NYN domain-containing protein n=1 Tax=Hyphomicrobium sp. TaxID=82 RepID=UPI0025BC803D|nr:NYN domain-containing protein [Hyphomicrobium sp.]
MSDASIPLPATGPEMSFLPNERIALFIDGPNLAATAKSLDFDIDFKLLLMLFRQRTQLLRAYYFTALTEDTERSIRPLLDWLEYNGFTVITKLLKECTDASGRRRIRGSMDVELAVQAMQLDDAVQHVVLFSGDGAFRCLAAALQGGGKRVSVVSTLNAHPPVVADELRRQADQFIDLAHLQNYISREAAEQ